MIPSSSASCRFISRRNLIIRVSSPLLQRREFSHRPLKTRVYPSEISWPSRDLTKYGSLRSSSSSLQISFCSRHLSHMSSKESQSAKSVHDFTVKVDVNGENSAPVYKFLKSSKGGFFGENIKWNFAKFLVGKDGIVVDRYAPVTSPLSIEKDIKKLLGAS